MGRVARYKKVKSFDPYSRESKQKRKSLHDEYVWGSSETRKPKKRSLKSMTLRQQKLKNQRPNKRKQQQTINNGFDIPPEEDDFDLNDIIGSVKKQQVMNIIPKSEPPPPTTTTTTKKAQSSSSSPSSSTALSTSESLIETDNLDMVKHKMINERKEHQELLRFTTKNERQETKKNVFEKKQKGESMRAYEKRIKEETRRIIDTNKLTTEKETASSKQQQQQQQAGDDTTNKRRQRTKDYLQQKKLKRKKKLQSFANNDTNDENYTRDSDNDDNFVTGEEAIRQQQLAFLNPVEQPPTFTQLPRGAPKKSKMLHKPKNTNSNNGRSSMDEAKIKAEQKSMEAMRLRVQSQYALIKAKRKQMGDFHL